MNVGEKALKKKQSGDIQILEINTSRQNNIFQKQVERKE